MAAIIAFLGAADETRVFSRASETPRGRPSGRVRFTACEGKSNRSGKPKKLNILELERRYTQHLVVYALT